MSLQVMYKVRPHKVYTSFVCTLCTHYLVAELYYIYARKSVWNLIRGLM